MSTDRNKSLMDRVHKLEYKVEQLEICLSLNLFGSNDIKQTNTSESTVLHVPPIQPEPTILAVPVAQIAPSAPIIQSENERLYPIIDNSEKKADEISICKHCNSNEIIFHVCNGTEVCANCGKSDRIKIDKKNLGNYKVSEHKQAKNLSKCEKCEKEVCFGMELKHKLYFKSCTKDCLVKLILVGGALFCIGYAIGFGDGGRKNCHQGWGRRCGRR